MAKRGKFEIELDKAIEGKSLEIWINWINTPVHTITKNPNFIEDMRKKLQNAGYRRKEKNNSPQETYFSSADIKVDGHIGTWYIIDSVVYDENTYYLLEHNTYGDEVPCIAIKEDKSLLLEDIYNGIQDIIDYLQLEGDGKQ